MRCYTVATRLDVAAAFRTEFKFGFGSGAGIRTLNLAVNRSLRPAQKWRPEFAEYHRVTPISTVHHRRCCTKGEPFQRRQSYWTGQDQHWKWTSLGGRTGSFRSAAAPRCVASQPNLAFPPLNTRVFNPWFVVSRLARIRLRGDDLLSSAESKDGNFGRGPRGFITGGHPLRIKSSPVKARSMASRGFRVAPRPLNSAPQDSDTGTSPKLVR
jgi:hypothetical protein